MGVFKSYDIRGFYPGEWNRTTAYRIGLHLPALLEADEILVGRDVRRTSAEIFAALSDGIRDAGCGVCDVGLCTTPSLYFATVRYRAAGSVMITASHNPPEYNGLKISRREAVPVGYESGLEELERQVAAETRSPGKRSASVRTLDMRRDYLAFLEPYGRGVGPVRAVIDCSDGMAGVFAHDVFRALPARVTWLYDEPDGGFPHHEPNPLEESNLADLKRRTVEEGADLGICFDGDADRVVFVDETGAFVSPDLVIGLLGRHFFDGPDLHGARRNQGAAVSYDVRTSRSAVRFIEELGGRPVMCKVGHSHAKKLLREVDGLYGGELAGHYYFRDNAYCDSGMIAALLVLSILSKAGAPLSRLVGSIRRHCHSGEINFRVGDKDRVIARILEDYRDGALTTLDGIRIDYPTWWFNLRKSNTEPYLRLVAEADTREELAARVTKLREKIEAGGQ